MKAIGLVLLGTLTAGLLATSTYAGITERKGPPPQSEASIAKALAAQRTAGLMGSIEDMRRNAGQSDSGGDQFLGSGAGGKRSCITNVGVTQAPQTGSRYGPGSTVAGDQRTVVIKGDIINICS